jgi:glucokinase
MDMSFAIGVDLGGTNLRIAAVSRSGDLLEKMTIGTKVAMGRDAVIEEMTAAIKDLSAKFLPSRSLLGVGIGVPGIIDERTGMLRESPNLPGWNDYPVRAEIERRLKAPVVLENDADAAAIGEAWLGAGRNFDSMCMITLGTGVGGGIVLNGRVWHGMTGMAGELGHIVIDPNGPKCGCGGYGCIEQYASAKAVMRMAQDAIASGAAPELARAAAQNPEFDARIIHNLALQGDQAAQAIFYRVGWALGILLTGLVNALNLPMYVIGGGVSSAWVTFAPAMFQELQRRCFVYAATAPDDISVAIAEGASASLKALETSPRTLISRALLGSDAGLYGAARLPMVQPHLDASPRAPAAS